MEGKPFGRYRLVQVLGRGGMGVVWRAYDTETKRIVAVKVLPTHLAEDPIFEERFRREALAAAGLNDPHVVPIHNFGEIEGQLYVDMRLVVGRDLQAILEKGPLEPRRAVAIIEQIASALNEAHRIGLVHRDVKPSNILVTENDFAYLIDFGIARAEGEEPITLTGKVVGTLAYMAPERLNSNLTDPRGDTYALGCVLHECLTGSQPFPGDSIERQITAHLGLPPPRPSTMRAGVPPQIDAVVAKAMAKKPEDRYAPVTAMATAARAAISQPAPPPRIARPARPQQSGGYDKRSTGPPTGPRTVVGPANTPQNRAGPPRGAPPPSAPPRTPQPRVSPPSPPQNPAGQRGRPENFLPAIGGAVSSTEPTQVAPKASAEVPSARSADTAKSSEKPTAKPPDKPPEKRRRNRLPIVLGCIVAAVVLIGVATVLVLPHIRGHHAKSSANSSKTVLPNSGPFTGTYSADFGPTLNLRGEEVKNRPGAGKETWSLRSACGTNGCVATASRSSGAFDHSSNLVFDQVGDRWLAVALGNAKCKNQDVEVWNYVWLKQRADGALAGEWISDSLSCYSKQAVTFTRTGDADIASLADPASQAARVVSPAAALHGIYHEVWTYTGGKINPQEFNDTVETICLRGGYRCISRFVQTDGSGKYEVMTFVSKTWTRNEEFDSTCSSGGTAHIKISSVFPLPSPAQDPITQLSGHGHRDDTGTKCESADYEQVFTRTGD